MWQENIHRQNIRSEAEEIFCAVKPFASSLAHL